MFFITTNFKTDRYLNNFQEYLFGTLRLRKYKTSLQNFFLADGGSQGGFIVLLCNPDGKISPIHWQSRKICCVVKSRL